MRLLDHAGAPVSLAEGLLSLSTDPLVSFFSRCAVAELTIYILLNLQVLYQLLSYRGP